MSDDLPTFGKPSRPTSASSLSSRRTVRSSPGVPGSARARRPVGRRREVDVAAPALAALRDHEALAVARADRRAARRSRRRRPACRAARAASGPRRRGRTGPCSRPARPTARAVLAAVAEVEQRRQAARRRPGRRLPPSPPSPPDGPPLGTNFSRRNATAPLPPSPALTWMRRLVDELHGESVRRRRPAWSVRASRRASSGGDFDAGDRARAGAPVLDLAGREREQREVASHPDVRAGVNHRADLADQDVARPAPTSPA